MLFGKRLQGFPLFLSPTLSLCEVNRMWVCVCTTIFAAVSQSVSQSAISMCDLNVERDIDIRWTTARIVLTFQFRCAYAFKQHDACMCLCNVQRAWIGYSMCNVYLVLQIVLQLGRSISIAWIGRAFRMQPELGQTDRSKPLANGMTFMHCFRCTQQRTSFYVVFIFLYIVLVSVVIFYSIGIISRIRLSHFMGIELFFSLARALSNENVNANNNKSDTNIISLTFLGTHLEYYYIKLPIILNVGFKSLRRCTLSSTLFFYTSSNSFLCILIEIN